MMKWFLKLILSTLIILTALAVCLYTLPQTKLLGSWFANRISSFSEYEIQFSDVQHSLSSANQFAFNNLSLADKSGDPILKANKAIIELTDNYSFLKPFNLNQIKTLYIQDADLYLNAYSASMPIDIESLQFKNIAIHYATKLENIELRGATGRISNWPADINLLFSGEREFEAFIKNIKFSANKASTSASKTEYVKTQDTKNSWQEILSTQLKNNQLSFKNVLIRAQHLKNKWYINEFGADWFNGAITAKVQIELNSDNHIENFSVENISFNNIKTTLNLQANEIIDWLSQQTAYIKAFSIYDSSLSGTDWSIENIDLDVNNIKLEQGVASSTKLEKSTFSLQANKFFLQDMPIDNLNINIRLEDKNWLINHLSGNIFNGEIKTNGLFNWSESKLDLDTLLLSNFSFTLQQLPPLVNRLATNSLLKLFTVNSLIIANLTLQDVSSDFPWQMRGVNINSKTLSLIDDGKWGYWQGFVDGSMNNLSINGIDFSNGLTFSSLAAKDKWLVHDLKASTGVGFISLPSLTIYRGNSPRFELQLSAQDITKEILSRWKWPQNTLTDKNGDLVNIKLELSGNAPLASASKSNQYKSWLLNLLADYLQDVTGKLTVTHSINYQNPNTPDFTLTQQLDSGKLLDAQYQEIPKLTGNSNLSSNAIDNELTEREALLAQAERLANMHNIIQHFFDIYEDILQKNIDAKLHSLEEQVLQEQALEY